MVSAVIFTHRTVRKRGTLQGDPRELLSTVQTGWGRLRAHPPSSEGKEQTTLV